MKVDKCGTQNLYIFCGGAFHRRDKNGKKIFVATAIVFLFFSFLFLLLKLRNGIAVQEIL
jgi:hypothetical protein